MYFMRQQAFKMLILNSESLDLTLLEQVTKILSASNFDADKLIGYFFCTG